MATSRFPFTMARLEKAECPPGKDRTYIRDEKVAGLCLMVTSMGAKSFYLYRKIDARPERILLGGFPDINVDTARDLASKQIAKIADGKNPAEERRTKRGAMTLAELLTHYLDTHAKAHKKRWRDDVKQFERYFGKAPEDQKPDDDPVPFHGWRSRQVNKIDGEAVKVLHVKLGEKHGKYAANRLLALLSSMYGNANLPNPTTNVKKFKEEQRERFLDADELGRFRQALDSEPDEIIADLFRILLFTMARRSNVAGMRWADVSFSRTEWTVPGEKTKNGDPLVVSLSAEAMAVLKRRWDHRTKDDKYVFPSYGRTGHITEPKAAWARILKSAEIENFRIHDLRHTGASWMAIGGTSLPIIGKALGHKSTQSTARYAHVNRSARAAAVQQATAAMAAMMNGAAAKPTDTKATA